MTSISFFVPLSIFIMAALKSLSPNFIIWVVLASISVYLLLKKRVSYSCFFVSGASLDYSLDFGILEEDVETLDAIM